MCIQNVGRQLEPEKEGVVSAWMTEQPATSDPGSGMDADAGEVPRGTDLVPLSQEVTGRWTLAPYFLAAWMWSL